jgi:hypothetical protein
MLKKEYEVQKETDQQFFEEQEEERVSMNQFTFIF